uniref:C-factor n=1 Tax=Cacopsylla melanoneura TaxID=428564 RepID=A0A8D8V4B6_9HEMI
MKSILITGCNRGLGLGMIKTLVGLENTLQPAHIFATCRNKAKAQELVALEDQHPNFHVFEIDITDFSKHQEVLVNGISNIVKSNGLNVLVNNAGISSKFTRIGMLKPEQMTEHFLVNVTAPLMLTKALLPLLKAASQANSEAPLGSSRAAIVNVSSILGSIEDNKQGGFYPYRVSKSALNAATRSLSFDLKDDKILATAMHPGWVKTDMGGANAPLDVVPATAGIIKFIQGLNETHNGKFFEYTGKTIRW